MNTTATETKQRKKQPYLYFNHGISQVIDRILQSHHPMTRNEVLHAVRRQIPQAYTQYTTAQALDEISSKLSDLKRRKRAKRVTLDGEMFPRWTSIDYDAGQTHRIDPPAIDPTPAARFAAREALANATAAEPDRSAHLLQAIAAPEAPNFGETIVNAAASIDPARVLDPENPIDAALIALRERIAALSTVQALDTESTVEALDYAEAMLRNIHPDRAARLFQAARYFAGLAQ